MVHLHLREDCGLLSEGAFFVLIEFLCVIFLSGLEQSLVGVCEG